jgi:GTP cyclohydrolase II
LFGRIVTASAGHYIMLITAERARATGLLRSSRDDPLAITFPVGAALPDLHTIAAISGNTIDNTEFEVTPVQIRLNELAAAGLQLAKAACLLPALVAFELPDVSAADALTVAVRDIMLHAPQFGYPDFRLISRSQVTLGNAGACEMIVFRDEHSPTCHIAFAIGSLSSHDAVPVRLHSACFTGDLLGSLRCDCGEQLHTALTRMADFGGGLLLYLDQEGRGIGLANKLRAYVLQDAGLDTIDANEHLGFQADERRYDSAAAVLQALGIQRIRLLTNNPQRISALRDNGIAIVDRIPLVGTSNLHNRRYLRSKVERTGHLAEEAAN